MNWIILTIFSAFTGSLTRILQKMLLKDEQSDPFAFGFIFQLTVSALFLIYTLITKSFELPNLSGLGINIVVMTVFYSLANLFVFKAFKYTAASEVSIILASSTIWAVFAAILLLGEQLSFLKYIGIFLIILGVVSINYSKTKWKFNKGHLFALTAAVMYGVAFTNDAYIISRYQSIASYMVLAFALPGICTLVFRPSAVRHLKYFANLKVFRNLLVSSSFYALSALAIFTAYKLGGPASIISPIQQTSIICTVILSYFLLNEKDHLKQKATGTILAFLGVLLLL